jgi:Ca-activated chloride channel family protein
MLTLVYPWALLLAILPWLIRRRKSRQSRQEPAPQLPIYGWVAALPGVRRQPNHRSRWRSLLLMLVWLCVVIALARPQYLDDPIPLPVSGRDLMLALDISPSMEEADMVVNNRRVSRLTALKHVAGDFISRRSGDRIGLILFGTQPYLQVPLTFDHVTVEQLLDEAQLGFAGRATAIGDAITLGVKYLRQRPETQRTLILLTDGANTAGEIAPERAAALAEAEGVRVYTIAIGSSGDGAFGLRGLGRQSEIDEELLRAIAQTTGGAFFRANSTPELEMVYERINELEPIEQEGGVYRPRRDLFYWPLGAAVAGVIGLTLLRAGVRPAIARPRRHASSQGTRSPVETPEANRG